ncbi:MAG: methyltransferase domain-containing protein [Acidobacteriota bacterium]
MVTEPLVDLPWDTQDSSTVSGAELSGAYRLKDFPGSSHRILADWVKNLPPAAKVLEIGVGADPFAQLVRRGDLHWLGVDAGVSSLGAIRRTLTGGVIADAELLAALPTNRGAVILADTLEHLVDPERMLQVVFRALDERGTLLLSVPNVAHWAIRLSLLCGRFDYSDRGILDRTHRTFFTRRSMREMLSRNRFVVVHEAFSSVPLPFALPRAPKILVVALERLQRAAIWILPGVFAYQLLVLARARQDCPPIHD